MDQKHGLNKFAAKPMNSAAKSAGILEKMKNIHAEDEDHEDLHLDFPENLKHVQKLKSTTLNDSSCNAHSRSIIIST